MLSDVTKTVVHLSFNEKDPIRKLFFKLRVPFGSLALK